MHFYASPLFALAICTLPKTPHIHFLIPCYGGQISEPTFTSFLKFVVLASKLGLEWSLDTLINESLIPRGRNSLVARALANPKATHAMFIDSDIRFSPENIIDLIKEDVAVIGGAYPKKSLPIEYVLHPLSGGFSDSTKAEVERIGTGFLLIKREVFARISTEMPHLKYSDDNGYGGELDPHLFAFFESGLFGHDVFLSEDWLFCDRWRSLGGQIYISKCFVLTHIGTYSFSEDSQVDLALKLKSFGDSNSSLS